MPNKDSLSSGFVGEDIPSQESMFSNISEFYRSNRVIVACICVDGMENYISSKAYNPHLNKKSSTNSYYIRIQYRLPVGPPEYSPDDRLGTTGRVGAVYRDGIH